MTRDLIAAKLVELLEKEKYSRDCELTPAMVLADEFKISIRDDRAKPIKTFGDMIDVVQSLTAAS
jgi:hypothetical protein